MATVSLSERQQDVLKAVCEVMKADIDWNEVAKLANMKTSKYARDTWTTVRNKIVGDRKSGDDDGEKADGVDGSTNGSAKKKATGGKRKKADDDDGESPTKKQKSTPRKSKKNATVQASTEEDGEQDGEAVKQEPETNDLLD